ncbi:MAG TPA: amidohydrolase [Candidatus Limnocylindria bacterium]|jgi:amidohydrolase|nr:amidohydrolase [Candidatus Limnocylindria bacterium]
MTADALRSELVALSRAIHGTPELAYQERTAVKNIAALLARHEHTVEAKLGGLETAFRARVGPPGPAVALLAEYDALPEIGHACGHNLIAMSNVGAFLLAAERAKDLKVGIELVGTPAEESGGGKIDLIDAGVFRDTVAVLSSHPSGDPDWEFGGSSLGVVAKRVTFHGVAAHAAFSPERGRNALSAAIRLFVAIDGWRQHLPADTRVHGIITKGGAAQNIIPELAECDIGLRAASVETLEEMQRTFAQMVEGAAMQTGTTAEIVDDMRLYAPVKPNARVGDLLAEELERRDLRMVRGKFVLASTDFGNVSQVAPADYIGFPVSEQSISGHSHVMRESSATDLAHRNAMITAEILAAAAVRIASDAELRATLRA